MDFTGFICDLTRNLLALWQIWAITAGLMGASSFLFFKAEARTNPKVKGWPTALYFTLICCTTIGFGDICPKTKWGKALAAVNGCIGLVAFGVFVAVVVASLAGQVG